MSLFILMIGCKNKATKKESNMQSYQSDSLKLSIQYPIKWEQKTNSNTPNMISFFEPLFDSADRYQENIQLWVEEIPFELPDSSYKQAAVTQIQIANPSLNIIRLAEVVTSHAHLSQFQFDFTTNDSSQYTVKGFVFLKGKIGYNINFTCEKNKSGDYQTIINQILQSFKPL